MIRRIALVAGALVAAVSLSSCNATPDNDVVAEADGVQLTRTQLDAISDGATDGATVRATITKWLSVAVLGGDVSGVESADDLAQRRADAIDELSAPFMDEARTTYEQGLDGSPVLCLVAIPLRDTDDPAAVIAEIEGGADLADVAAKYSADATLAQSGGKVVDQNGTNCLAPDGFNVDLLGQLTDAGAAPGVPVQVDLGSGPVVVVLRPFDSLDQNEKASIVIDKVGAEVKSRLQGTDITVNPRYGRWDPASVSVVPLGEG